MTIESQITVGVRSFAQGLTGVGVALPLPYKAALLTQSQLIGQGIP
ncbi:MAG: hypothetical protein MK052_03880 [Alphaproteobacteria bacterium]|nr:hypothetical protein [Alphaproteobacteria bacterium]